MATTHTWSGLGGTQSWDDPANWDPNNPSYTATEHFVIDASAPAGPFTIDMLDFSTDQIIDGLVLDNALYTLDTAVGVDGAGGLLTLETVTHVTITDGTLALKGFKIDAGTNVEVGAGGTITMELRQGADAQIVAATGIVNAGLISGFGTVSGDLSGTGDVVATGGTLSWTGDLNGTNLLQIDDTAIFELVDATTLNSSSVEFIGVDGTLRIGTASVFTGGVLNGMGVGTGAGDETTVIDFDGKDVQNASFNNATDTLTVNFVGGGSASFDTDDLAGAFANWDHATDRVFLTDTVCYAAGTRVLTARGDVTVDDIRVGDQVIVLDGDTRSVLPVKWVGVREVNLAAHADRLQIAPVRIAKGAFAENIPSRDLIVSPPHAIFVDGKLVQAKMLVNDMTITREMDLRSVTYYHVELERHAVILAENLPAESYLDTGNRSFFRNAPVTALGAAEYHVDDASEIWEDNACAPLAIAPNDVRPYWEALADRAESLGFSRPVVETTLDADLHVEVNGRRIDAVEVQNRTYRFVLPAGADMARLVSRATAPAALAAYRGDARSLGVSIRSIATKSGGNVEVFSADHPALRDGWHTVERLGTAMWRWSNGNAALPVVSNGQPVVLEVQVGDTATYALMDMASEVRVAA